MPSLIFIALVVAAVGSLGAPLITSVATTFGVSLAAAQWTLTEADELLAAIRTVSRGDALLSATACRRQPLCMCAAGAKYDKTFEKMVG